MEEVVAQIVVSEIQQVKAYVSQKSTRTSSGDIPDVLRKIIEEIKADNALVKEHLDK